MGNFFCIFVEMAVFAKRLDLLCPVSLSSAPALQRKTGRADRQGWLLMSLGSWEGLVGRRRWTKQGLVTDDSSRQPATYLLLCICNCICCALFQYRVLQLAVSYHHHWHCHRQGEEDPGSQRCNFQPSAHTVTNLQKVHTDYFYCCKI